MIEIYGGSTPESFVSMDPKAVIRQTEPGRGGRNITIRQLDKLMSDDECWQRICDLVCLQMLGEFYDD